MSGQPPGKRATAQATVAAETFITRASWLCRGRIQQPGRSVAAGLEPLAVSSVHRNRGPMRAYSEDLREKIVEAVGRGMSKTAAAEAFGVSRSSVERYVRATREGEPLAPKRHPGSRPKLDERARGYWRPTRGTGRTPP